ncbi:hypothetical protein [Bacillus sp. 165]|nr:hypothetical protein [Bacillus sp. 165]
MMDLNNKMEASYATNGRLVEQGIINIIENIDILHLLEVSRFLEE